MNEGPGAPEPAAELQFDKAELASPSASRVCPICKNRLGLEYYEVVGNVVCPACAEGLVRGKGGLSFLRALLFGAGAALVSTVLWYLIMKQFDKELGIVAIAVGFFVGMAVRRGSGVVGGVRYQALAMALTYFSITASHVPFVVEELRKARQEQMTKSKTESGAVPNADQKPPAAATQTPPSLGQYLAGWAIMFAMAFAMPFLAGASGIIGLIIIGIALYEAWKLNRRVPVNGPFRFGIAPATT